jgi:hypothetical protein
MICETSFYYNVGFNDKGFVPQIAIGMLLFYLDNEIDTGNCQNISVHSKWFNTFEKTIGPTYETGMYEDKDWNSNVHPWKFFINGSLIEDPKMDVLPFAKYSETMNVYTVIIEATPNDNFYENVY